jgi:hypothetical protein
MGELACLSMAINTPVFSRMLKSPAISVIRIEIPHDGAHLACGSIERALQNELALVEADRFSDRVVVERQSHVLLKFISKKGLTAGQNVCNLQIFIATCLNACKMQNTCIFGTFAKCTVKTTCTFGISGIFGTFANS